MEIGELASKSVSTAEHAGELLGAIVPSIQRTSDLVQEITAASQEQSESVKQIGAAMDQLSMATQQNASASEELAATSEELSGQAVQLQESVSFFHVGDHAKQEKRDAGNFRERRAPDSPMRGNSRNAAASPSYRAAAVASGDFRPY